MSAYDAPRAVPADRIARPNGWWGMVLFVCSESTLFGTIIGTYVYLRIHDAHWPPPGVAKPDALKPALLTLALVLTSIPIQAAWRAGSAGRRHAAWRLILLAFAVQTAYLVWQVHDYVNDIHATPPSQSAYASILFTMLGADHLHVLLGLLFDVWLLLRIATRLTSYRLTALRSIAFYWHAVNAITAVVLLVELSPYL